MDLEWICNLVIFWGGLLPAGAGGRGRPLARRKAKSGGRGGAYDEGGGEAFGEGGAVPYLDPDLWGGERGELSIGEARGTGQKNGVMLVCGLPVC